MAHRFLAEHAQLTIGLVMGLGVWVLVWGLPRANRHLLPWRWRIGILYIGLGLIFWPPFYTLVLRPQLGLGILLLIAPWLTLVTFGLGIKRLRMADQWKEDTLGVAGAYDFGWVMRPRPKNPSQEDLVRGVVEDLSNPLAALLRRRTQTHDPDKDPDDGTHL